RTMNDVAAKPQRERVDRQLKAPPPGKGAEEVELDLVIDGNQVISSHANQAEWTGMAELVEEIDRDRIKPLGDVGRLTEPPLPRQDLELCRLELGRHAVSDIALLSQAPADCFG